MARRRFSDGRHAVGRTLAGMPEAPRCYCRNCAYELTALPNEEQCPECGDCNRVESKRAVRVATPWYGRLWPIGVGLISALPVLWKLLPDWKDDGVDGVIVGATFVLSFWLIPFIWIVSLGWTCWIIPHAARRVSAQIIGSVSVVLFPGLLVTEALINPTDPQSGLALLLMPTFGTPMAMIGAAAGWLVARLATR